VLNTIMPPALAEEHVTATACYCTIKNTGALFSVFLNLEAASVTNAEIDQIVSDESPDEKPEPPVIDAAKNIVSAAAYPVPFFLAASEVECFEKRLLVHWALGSKRVTLITSGPEARTRIYKKTATNLSELTTNPSPVDLRNAINWILEM